VAPGTNIGTGIGTGIGGGIGAGIGPSPGTGSLVVERIQYVGLSPELQQRVENHSTIRVGDTWDSSRFRRELQEIDEHLFPQFAVTDATDPQHVKVTLLISLVQSLGTPPPAPPALPPGVYRIGGGVSAPIPVVKPEPEYSEEARKAKWQGAVMLQLVIDANGVPLDIKIVRSLGLGLDQKAIEAVQKWRFKPGLKDGNPVPVSANIEVNFRLPQSPEAIARAVTVGEGIMSSQIVSRVPPEYPPAAKLARIQGSVQLGVTIGPDGKVQDVQFNSNSGPAMLVKAASDAVAQWVYQPFLLNGQPVTVQTTATVNFVLN
jgi:TonB family protein